MVLASRHQFNRNIYSEVLLNFFALLVVRCIKQLDFLLLLFVT